MFTYLDYPQVVVQDVVRLRRRTAEVGFPEKRLDRNLIVGSWNIAQFGRLRDDWVAEGDPVRNLRGLATIAEMVRGFDVLAIQEVKRDTIAIRRLVDDFLGPTWGLLLSDVSAGDRGNHERLAFIYDLHRVQPTGLAGEIVLVPNGSTPSDQWPEQFDRTPYMVGFTTGSVRFTLLTVHIRWGDGTTGPSAEVQRLAHELTANLRANSQDPSAEEQNLILLGDFNMHSDGSTSAFATALGGAGMIIPTELNGIRTTLAREPTHYDHIAWFQGALNIPARFSGGAIPFGDIVFRDRAPRTQLGARASDHYPIWIEFNIDRSVEQFAQVLGVEPDPRLIEDAVDP